MKENKRDAAPMMALCAIIFVAFTFCYLYFYQADILAAAQHVLSGGKTVYNPTIGAVIITVLLWLIHAGVYAFTGLRGRTHALTYLPSLLLLAFITDIDTDIYRGYHFDNWLWLFPLILLVYIGVIALSHTLQPYEPEGSKGLFSKLTAVNLLQMVCMCLAVGCIGTRNDVFHYRMTMESRLLHGDPYGALEVGRGAPDTDSSLTMLRIAALEATHQLGDHLFEYPVVGGSRAMQPDDSTTYTIRYRIPRKYRNRPDHKLMALLLDKKLDAFAAAIGQYYNIDSSNVPKHFREALVLYTHHRANPKLVYHNPVMDADFQDYQSLAHKYANPIERQSALRDTYGNTYWYYFQYE